MNKVLNEIVSNFKKGLPGLGQKMKHDAISLTKIVGAFAVVAGISYCGHTYDKTSKIEDRNKRVEDYLLKPIRHNNMIIRNGKAISEFNHYSRILDIHINITLGDN